MKTCKQCRVEKPFSEFYKSKENRGGYTTMCKLCRKDYDKIRNSKPEQKVKQREWSYKRRYGISIEEYDRLAESQDHACKICGSTDSKRGNKFLLVDHNHETDEIRGLLCNSCNVAIGLLGDNISTLQNAITYLNNATYYPQN
jgi:hypothetical protein